MKVSPLVQYRIQLFRCGFRDDFVGRNTVSIAYRKEQVEAQWSRWSRLQPAETTTVNLCGTLGANEFVGGVFSTVVGEKSTSLRFIRLPSSSRGIAQEEWTLNNLPMPINGYTTDPTSDLLIVYEDQSTSTDTESTSEVPQYVVSHTRPGRTWGRLILYRQDSPPHPSRLRREGTSKSCFANYRTPGGR